MASKTVADVMKMVKENEVKFVDFRFTDTRGKEQHVTVPVSAFDDDKFTSGHAFDGSSIAGWKGIEASDMTLMPDPNTANLDPFFEEPTLLLTCDVIDPAECSVSSSSPLYVGNPERISGLIARNIQSAGPLITLIAPSVLTLSCTFATDSGVGAPPVSPVP